MEWTICLKSVTGKRINLKLAKGGATSIRELKEQVHRQDTSLPPYLQRISFPGPDGNIIFNDEEQLLSSFPAIKDKSIFLLVILTPFVVYVQGVDGRKHTITVKSAQPDNYPVSSLMQDVEKEIGCNFTTHQLLFQDKPLQPTLHGKDLTLRDCRIRKEESLFIQRMGFTLNITNPQVDLCFLVDCTGSMRSHIEAVKNSVKQLRDDLVKQYKGCDIRFAFVRYTDYDVTYDRTTYLDFTRDDSAFYTFVNGITADGGGDSPEDIMGGLKVALNSLTWRSDCSRVLVHIADCPCHGTMYHDIDDNSPNGDRDGITHEHMMARVKDLEVDYWFGYINRQYTDKMISIFNECLQRISNQRLLIRQFDAIQPTEVKAAVGRSISASVTGTAAARVKKYKLDPIIPDWKSTSQIEIYGQKSPAVGIKSLNDLQTGLTLEQPSIPITFKCAPNPFADGTECLVYHGYDFTSRRAIVLKKYKREGEEFNTLDCYMREIEVRTICTTYASHFNSDKNKPSGSVRLEVTPVDVVSCAGQDHYLLETFLGGKVEKYSNNAGLVFSKSPHSELLQAFSHFTWVTSGKSLVICDLQGVESGSGRVTLTDPAIHSHTPGGYGPTDLGRKGIQSFFKTHVCGMVCGGMGLNTQIP